MQACQGPHQIPTITSKILFCVTTTKSHKRKWSGQVSVGKMEIRSRVYLCHWDSFPQAPELHCPPYHKLPNGFLLLGQTSSILMMGTFGSLMVMLQPLSINKLYLYTTFMTFECKIWCCRGPIGLDHMYGFTNQSSHTNTLTHILGISIFVAHFLLQRCKKMITIQIKSWSDLGLCLIENKPNFEDHSFQ